MYRSSCQHTPEQSDLTRQEAEFRDEEGRSRGRGSGWPPLLHAADEQHLVPITDVQVILLLERAKVERSGPRLE